MNLFGGTSNLFLKVVKKDLLTKLVMICDFLGLSLDENTVERGVVFLKGQYHENSSKFLGKLC